MLGVLAGVIVIHIFHLLVHKRIYSEEEDKRTLVKYSQPMRYLKSLTWDALTNLWCPDSNPRLKYAALSEVGENAALRASAGDGNSAPGMMRVANTKATQRTVS